ncbi:MAG: phosphofructokinase [Chloroflexi bacterium]|nr:MAG: phosphofructokinase [Chloroflexota bacterium]MBL1195197.1 phosphofructokinase [Chloroflexota bacterium]NOH12482.1 phosphofructokinase [Chloroflexota bacterium]
MKIGVLTGGGDVPGLNPCMKALVHRAIDEGHKVVGFRRGWWGPLHFNPDDPKGSKDTHIPLTKKNTRTIDRSGGTFLHSSRTNPWKVAEGAVPDFLNAKDFKKNQDGTYDCTPHVLKVLEHLGVDVLVPIGGDDTLGYGARLHEENFPVVSIPKTMDNDVFGTDYCLGFSTAITRSVQFIHQLRTSAGSHERIAVIELFGRYSGQTALISAYLADADRCIISEVPFDVEKLSDMLMKDKEDNPSHYAMVVVSEGAQFVEGEVVQYGQADAFGHKKLGGIGMLTSNAIKEITGTNTITQQLAYLMRSGAPDSLDLMAAKTFANMAMDIIARGNFGQMISLQDGIYTYVPADMVLRGNRKVDVDALYDQETYRPKLRKARGKPMFLY